jgi:hypothetical protein
MQVHRAWNHLHADEESAGVHCVDSGAGTTGVGGESNMRREAGRQLGHLGGNLDEVLG